MKISELTLDQLEEATAILKAIAHPHRMAILSLMEEGQKLTVTEIQKRLGLEQSVVSHHLGILKDKGVLISKRDGRRIIYSLRQADLAGILHCVGSCTSRPSGHTGG